MTCQLVVSIIPAENNKYTYSPAGHLLSNDENYIHLLLNHIHWSNSSSTEERSATLVVVNVKGGNDRLSYYFIAQISSMDFILGDIIQPYFALNMLLNANTFGKWIEQLYLRLMMARMCFACKHVFDMMWITCTCGLQRRRESFFMELNYV